MNINHGIALALVHTCSRTSKRRRSFSTAADGSRHVAMLSNVWHKSVDPTGYWMSEKHDGIRAISDGHFLVTRHGTRVLAPDWWLSHVRMQSPLVNHVGAMVDGELCYSGGSYHSLSRLFKRSSEEDLDEFWQKLTLIVFDMIPDQQHQHLTFQERLRWLAQLQSNSVVHVLQHTQCTGESHLQDMMKLVATRGGEGVMLRAPQGCYVAGRSDNLLKVRMQWDCEAKFLRKSETGISLICLLPNGLERKVKCLMEDYKYPPQPGTVVTLRHFGYLSNGGLKFPDFVRVRYDITWDQVLQDNPWKNKQTP